MLGFENYFSIQVFFIILRETLETAIIISVLLSFINQRSHPEDNKSISSSVHRKYSKAQNNLKLQVWVGAVIGLLICFIIGLIFVVCFYFIGKDYWSYTERLWEGIFSLLSSLIITIMGIGLLRINKIMKIKWWVKLGDAYTTTDASKLVDETENTDSDSGIINQQVISLPPKGKQPFTKKFFLAILPLVTTLREGLEAVVFIGGIGMSQPLTSLPLSILCGVLLGSFIGYVLYKGGNKLSLQYFLIFSTCFLYIVSAGLMSRGVWFLELERYVRLCDGLDVSETGSGPGSYDISKSVWHVNCCNGLTDGWWMVFNAIFGWTNSATYGSVISYCAYWLFVIIWLEIRLYEEREGVLPVIPIKWQLNRVKKKLKLCEMRYQQQKQQHDYMLSHEQDSVYHGLARNNSLDINPREAEAQLLLAS